MASRTSMVLGDPRHGGLYVGDPGLGSFLKGAARFVGGTILGLPLRAPTSLARVAVGARGALSKTAAIVRAHPAATAGAIAAAGAGGLAIEHAVRTGGGGGMAAGMTVLRQNRHGMPTKILAPNGKVINLVHRRKGISAAAISGAFRLARLAHMFAGVAHTGRRPRARRK